MKLILSLAIALGACGPSEKFVMPPNPPVLVTDAAQLEASVGTLVTLRGTVDNSKVATLLGVDVASESPDLRGQEATATGLLEKETVTQEQLDKELATRGQFANRGAGVFYRLVDPDTKRLAQVKKP